MTRPFFRVPLDKDKCPCYHIGNFIKGYDEDGAGAAFSRELGTVEARQTSSGSLIPSELKTPTQGPVGFSVHATSVHRACWSLKWRETRNLSGTAGIVLITRLVSRILGTGFLF